MSRDKQTEIEEMEIALREAQHAFDRAWKECLHHNAPMPDRENVFYAKYLVENKGYRKASEVAEEIFAEMENWFELYSEREYSFAEEETSKGHCAEAEAHDYALDIIKDLRYLCVAELKKKYAESEDTE